MSEEKKEKNFFDRLVEERDALMEKHIKLVKFLASLNKEGSEIEIPNDELDLLRLQEMVMKQYGFILERRINLISNRLKNDSIS